MNSDLFLAILSMDSYNRGYGQGIILTGNGIGNAVISKDSAILGSNGSRPDISAGFYALS